MKRIFAALLILCVCFPLTGAQFTEDYDIEITSFGYSFLLPHGVIYSCHSTLGTDRLWKIGCDEAFVIELVPLDRLKPSLNGLTEEDREACLMEFARLMNRDAQEVYLIHRDTVSILRTEIDGTLWLIAVAGPSAPCLFMRLIPPELETCPDYVRNNPSYYESAFDFVSASLSYSYFQSDPLSMTGEELIALQEEISQALAKTE